jgi:hypothetical protein
MAQHTSKLTTSLICPIFFLLWCSFVATPYVLSTYYDYTWEQGWKIFGVDAILPTFADLRSILDSIKCKDLGSALYLANPCDPLSLPYKHPQLLLHLNWIGIKSENSTEIGLSIILVFLLCGVSLLKPQSFLQLLYSLVVVSSSPLLLAIERGSLDLVIFIILVLFLLISKISSCLSYLAILLATTLSIYPIAALPFIFFEKRKITLFFAMLVWIVPSIVYITYYLPDIVHILPNTQTSVTSYFSASTFADSITGLQNSKNGPLELTLVTFLFLTGTFLAIRTNLFQSQNFHESSFLLGTFITVGIWSANIHASCGLLFLLFLIPFLSICSSSTETRSLGIFGLFLTALVLHSKNSTWFNRNDLNDLFLFILLWIAGIVAFRLLTGWRSTKNKLQKKEIQVVTPVYFAKRT